MKNNSELIRQFIKDSKFQDKLDYYDKEKAEQCLIDFIEVYQDVYLREENEILAELGENIKINKEYILNGLNRGYKAQLNILKGLNADISEYPKNLEDLTK